MSNGGGNYPARLTVSDLGGATVAVSRVSSARVTNFGGNYLDKSNQKLVLQLDDFPGKDFVLNRTSYQLLVERYGDHSGNGYRGLEGKLVVLKVTDTEDPNTGNKVKGLWIADNDTWRRAYAEWSKSVAAAAEEEHEERPAARKAPARKAATKRPRKNG